MTNDELEAVRARAEAATPGPWKACGAIYEHMNSEIRSGAKGEGRGLALVWDHDNAFRDAEFIAHARTDIPALLDEVAAWRQAASVEANQRREAEAHAERLAKALAPFAGEVPSSQFPGCGEFTGADLKAARSALSAYKEDKA